MNIHNFQLSSVFHDNAKEYQTRPVMAAKYQPEMENGFCVMMAFRKKSVAILRNSCYNNKIIG